jgi:hypothetical protein
MMRLLGFGVMVGMVILVAGCGGGSATSVEYNSGEPPQMPVPQEKARLEDQVEKRNVGASVICSRAHPATELDLWDCRVQPKNRIDVAEVEVLVPGFGGQYEVTECRSSPDQRYTQKPRGVCKEIR